jgi:uncharacterized protein DUF3854
VNPHLEFLLSSVYDGALTPRHWADLKQSALADETIAVQKIRSVPLSMIDQLAGFHVTDAKSAYLLPFADPRGGWMLDHPKMRVFAFATDLTGDVRGDQIAAPREKWRYNGGTRKYIVRYRSAPRLFFPLSTLCRVLESAEPVFLIEGEKKSLAVAQLGLPAVGLESAWGWHRKGASALLDDFGVIPLMGRVIELVPDSDITTNPRIATAMRRLADALRAAGARPRLVRIPREVKGADDYIMTKEGAA